MSKVVEGKVTSEAVAGFTHRTAMEEAARCLLCHDAPCSKGCPAGTDPAKFIRSIRFRNVKGAAETIRENNILGGTCARVCPTDKLCEEACSRCGIDKPIEIGKLQRYAIEQEKLYGMQVLKAPAKKKKGSIACVGAGPSSLACAAQLAKEGYAVIIFEREEKAGGVLTYGIVPSRLPQYVVDHDIDQVKALGVQFEFGKQVQAEDLTAFDAIFVGTGLWGAKLPPIKGIELEGVYAAAQYLKEARTEAFEAGKKVVVVGGGDVAVDCAVTAKLLGAEEVRIVYRRTLEEAPGNMTEFQYALSLGIGITTNMAPEEIEGTDFVERINFIGRDKNSVLSLHADTIVFAIGQEPENVKQIAEVTLTDKGTIAVTSSGQTSNAKVFAGGDIVNGGKTVVEAVAAGKEAADAILTYLAQKGVK
ncbi:FAD-dependent oxidoreductase [Clostridium aminobutyricum]|uniref:FAD-dependent oxidoreductase n=1 Tax=Clostridium aminobutyricum TaxID=33953 RepID=UPI002468F6E0|nr:FAD-dependent oxidoreductase [Clostridium aminobutyricum]